MLVIALTGGIATGKSTVAHLFSEFGLPVMDADRFSHETIAPHTKAWKEIVRHYGQTIVGEDDQIDRKKLGGIVFRNPIERKHLESIIHPVVQKRIKERLSQLSDHGCPLALVEVPLLFEVGWEKEFDIVVVVSCDEAEQKRRCKRKFGLTPEEVRERIAAQIPLTQKCQAADFVINNSGSIDDTRTQVKKIYEKIRNQNHRGTKVIR